jgi:hypothetical protein
VNVAVTDEMATYLNDHLAGAAAGVDLIKQISAEMGGAVDDLVADIETDRAFLEDLVKALGIREQTVKQAVSTVIEKLGKLKMNRVVSGSRELALLLEMEAMSMGIEGKRCLWQTLESAAPAVPEIAETDFAAMILRAEDQRDRLEAHRRTAATAALAAAAESGAG